MIRRGARPSFRRGSGPGQRPRDLGVAGESELRGGRASLPQNLLLQEALVVWSFLGA